MEKDFLQLSCIQVILVGKPTGGCKQIEIFNKCRTSTLPKGNMKQNVGNDINDYLT